MNKSIIKTIVFMGSFVALAISIHSCNDAETPPVATNEEELITTVKLDMTDTLTGQKFTYFFRDLDGEGGNSPSQWDTVKLNDSSFYRVTLKFLNESNPNAIVDISQEIYNERTMHLICLNPAGINAAITRTDTDGTFELGLTSTWKTGAASTGDITVSLKHQPDIKDGTCTPGETDVEVKFPAKVW